MGFKKGHKLATGRPKGSENELTKKMKTVKDAVMSAFHEMQEDRRANLLAWGRDNPTEFYKIAAKLIPTEVTANVEVVKRELPPFMKSNESES